MKKRCILHGLKWFWYCIIFTLLAVTVQAEGIQEQEAKKKQPELSVWMENPATQTDKEFSDTPLAKELEARTGVAIRYIHPPLGNVAEHFNLIIASNDLPDVFFNYNWITFPGGPENAIDDKIILDHTPLIKANAPNLQNYLSENPAIDKMIKTDSGVYYGFPFVRGDDLLLLSFGPMMRKDWLDELGLEVPATIGEWENALRAFKAKKNATIPFTCRDWHFGSARLGSFIFGAYGSSVEFYQENGKVKYGPIEENYRQGLEVYLRWFNEGLLDTDFAAQDGKTFDAKITSGKTGAFIHSTGSGMGRYISLMKDDPSFKLVGVPWPSLVKDEKAKAGMKDFNYWGKATAITTKCDDVQLATTWLDYGYGKEGHMLMNFGIENESYKIDSDGDPVYTDIITNNPQGFSLANALKRYVLSASEGPFIQDVRYIMQYYSLEEQRDALLTWNSSFDDSYRIPPVTPLPEDSRELSRIMNEIQTYVSEMRLRFILGVEPLDKFDQYVNTIKDMNIDKAITLTQAALDRYNNR